MAAAKQQVLDLKAELRKAKKAAQAAKEAAKASDKKSYTFGV